MEKKDTLQKPPKGMTLQEWFDAIALEEGWPDRLEADMSHSGEITIEIKPSDDWIRLTALEKELSSEKD